MEIFMPETIIVHISNEEPFLAEIDELPGPRDTVLILSNPRRRDGREVTFLSELVTTVAWPWSRINFIEIISSQQEEEIISSIRE